MTTDMASQTLSIAADLNWRTWLRRGVAFALGFLIVTSAALAFASEKNEAPEKMDETTHTIVIDKLELALKKAKDDETVSLAPIRSRLADLYSDRARIREMKEAEQKCSGTGSLKVKGCDGSMKDRKRALELYSAVVKETDQANRGALLVHMANLYKLVDQPEKALAIFDGIIKDGARLHSTTILSEAYSGRGESRYMKAQFAKAQDDFEAALRMAPKYKRGAIAHRIAWCHLNRGDQPTAVAQLIAILTTPDLLKRESTDGPKLDLSFQEDVATDLVTFLSRGTLKSGDAKRVADLAPEHARLRITKFFASEAERLGQKRAALEAWALASTMEPKGESTLENTIHIARVKYDLGDKAGTLQSMQESVKMWKELGCKDDCENLRKRLRNLVTDWHRAEHLHPSEPLLGAYIAYNSLFENDLEMNFFAAQVAREEKRATDAAAMYHKTSLLASKPAKSGDKTAVQILDASLAGEVEMAEAAPKGADSFTLRQNAYDHYLRMAPQGPLAHSVRYQRARLPYEQGANDEASVRLERFAKSDACRGSKSGEEHQLCLQAADLDMDARVQLKDDESVEQGALAYSKIYSERKLEYLKMARTSALKQSQNMDASSALSKLAHIDTTGMDRNERLRLVKTRLTLAEKSKDLDGTTLAAKELMSLPKLDAKDHQYALSRLAWVAEMKFDFKAAYALNEKMQSKELTPADRELRLAMFAELAGQDQRRHQEQFLRLSRDPAKRAVIRAKLVRSARNPILEMRHHEQELARFPSIYAPLVFEVYAKTGNRSFADHSLRSRALRAQPAGRALARQIFLIDFSKADQKIASHRLKTKSDRQIQASLRERIKLLAQSEKAAMQAIQSKDWTAQLVTLAALSRENKRLYTEILALPVPRQLKGQDRVTYLNLLEQNANVYLAKNQAIEQKLAMFWKDSAAFTNLVSDFDASTRPEVRRALAKELRVIAKVAPVERRQRLEKALSESGDEPSTVEVATVLKSVKEKPFSSSKLEKLRSLEMSRGRETMVAYLDARLMTLKSGSNEEKKQ